MGELGGDLLWWCVHSAAALGMLALVLLAMTVARPDAFAPQPKLLATLLAFCVPAVGGALVGWTWARDPRCWPGRFCWVTGVLLLAAVSVWVIGLPTGPGMCESCTSGEKLVRTFFAFDRGSGLLGGDGLLVGCWAPLALFGYSAGVMLGLRL